MTSETLPQPRIRRPVWVLVALLICLVVLVGYQTRRARSTADLASAATGRSTSRNASGPGEAPADVRLEALEERWPERSGSSRNPFRFQPTAPPAAVRPAPVAPRPAAPTAGGNAPGGPGAAVPGQAPPSPIPLKFIGTIEAPGVGKIAALSDGKFVYHGREGDVIEGRYRIVKIGIESIVMEHLDGRGRQTIRLTG